MSSEIIEPVKTETLHLNDQHNVVPLEEASWILNMGYDDKGNLVFEEWEKIKNESYT